MLNWVEHEKCFITSGPDFSTILSAQVVWVYRSKQYSVHLLRISCSSVRVFPYLSWIVVDLPSFSEIRSYRSWYAVSLYYRQVSISLHCLPIQSSSAFLTAFWILLLAPMHSFAPSATYRLFFQISPLITESRISLVTQGLFLRRSLYKVFHWLR